MTTEITLDNIKSMLSRIHGDVEVIVNENFYKGYKEVRVYSTRFKRNIYRYVIDEKKNLVKTFIYHLICSQQEHDERPECIRFMKNC